MKVVKRKGWRRTACRVYSSFKVHKAVGCCSMTRVMANRGIIAEEYIFKLSLVDCAVQLSRCMKYTEE